MKVREVDGVLGQCPLCHHPPIRHLEDGLGGATCVVCAWLSVNDASEGKLMRTVCTVKFAFKLSKRERELAKQAYKGSHPQRAQCAVCFCEWRAHEGYLCPTGDSTFVPYLDEDKPFLYTK